jgi:ribonuclease BN (tRNA processing enzyme)
VYRGGRAFLEELGSRLGFPDMFERTFTLAEYDGDMPFVAAGLEVLPVRLPHYRLETYGFRVTNGRATLAYTGDTGPSERIAELARDADLLVCEATLETGEADGEPRGHLSAEEALDAYAASGARNLLLTHRPSELPTPEGIVLAYDGMELEVVPQSVRGPAG